MVVDDSITMRRVASKLLERHNYDVVTAKDGVDALYAPRRTVLDPMLVRAARRAGADVVHGVGVDQVERDLLAAVDDLAGDDLLRLERPQRRATHRSFGIM